MVCSEAATAVVVTLLRSFVIHTGIKFNPGAKAEVADLELSRKIAA